MSYNKAMVAVYFIYLTINITLYYSGNSIYRSAKGQGEIFFVISRVRYIEHLHDLTNFRENYQNDRYIEVKLIINLQNPAFPDLKN